MIGALTASILGDRLLRPARWRGKFYFSIAVMKYFVVPISVYGAVREYGCRDIEEETAKIIEKYNFGMYHFEEAFRVFERA
jgi:hypothetical protein